ncbi:hypothetical protein BRD56_11195 [Thermoplasmatales archaeon SW_10_69_26]|nr:MAG: hypothetical protein BRD56_11195 [Thermoplasmatales archaeon SW_10_69_26]
MPAASDEELLRALHEVEAFEMKHPQAFEDLVDLVDRNRRIGYKNLCKMMLGRLTEEEIQGE